MRELQDVEVSFVSAVKKPANKKFFFFSKSDDGKVLIPEGARKTEVKVVKKDDEQQLIYGIVYTPDEVDAQGDFMTAVEIEKSAHNYLEKYRAVDVEHSNIDGAGVVVESYIAPVDMNINETKIKKGSWIQVTKANDKLWELYKSGEITGYSMYGFAKNVVEKKEEESNVEPRPATEIKTEPELETMVVEKSETKGHPASEPASNPASDSVAKQMLEALETINKSISEINEKVSNLEKKTSEFESTKQEIDEIQKSLGSPAMTAAKNTEPKIVIEKRNSILN